MNAKMKKRMIAVSGVIVIVLILVLAFVGGNTAATTLSVAEAAENPQAGQKVQVSGNVVQDSFATTDNVLTFKIYDPEGDPATHLEVRYDGAASSTFGNDVTAICTGKINEAGVLECSNLGTYAWELSQTLRLPVFDIGTAAQFLRLGLVKTCFRT